MRALVIAICLLASPSLADDTPETMTPIYPEGCRQIVSPDGDGEGDRLFNRCCEKARTYQSDRGEPLRDQICIDHFVGEA